MSFVSFAAHRDQLVAAYQAVLADDDVTNWALFSYKLNGELFVEATGDEGLEELESEFNSGKVQYAFARVQDPNTKLHKFILIIWQGEGVPATKKGQCANHVNDIKRFFKIHHMTISARNDDDVTADEIMRHVTKSTSSFNIGRPSVAEQPASGAVSSVYRPTRPIEEIQKVKNENFWQKVQAEEEARKRDEARHRAEKERAEQLRMKEEQQRSEVRRKAEEEKREKMICEKLRAQRLADSDDHRVQAERDAWQQQLKEQQSEMENQRRSRRSSSIEHARV